MSGLISAAARRLRTQLATATGSAAIGYGSSTVQTAIDAVKATAPGNRLRPAYLEQFVTGMHGRGMLTAEVINTPTEQAITQNSAAGADILTVENNAAFTQGGCVTVKHDNGKYRTYFVSSLGAGTVAILPGLYYPVSAGARIERTWYNRAHPGKFYMRELAQRIAGATEIEAAIPQGERLLFTDFSGVPADFTVYPTSSEDLLTAGGGAVAYYYAQSNTGPSADKPIEFLKGRGAYVEFSANGAYADTALVKVKRPGQAMARVTLMCRHAAPVLKIKVIDEAGIELASYTVPTGKMQMAHQVYNVPFLIQGSKSIKVRVVVDSGAIASAFLLDMVDVFELPGAGGPIIAKADARIVCFGDSWVAGDLGNTPEREPITVQLAKELPYATIINAGVGGNALYHLMARFDTDVVPYKPDYVVINTGTNDSYSPASATFDPNAVDYFVQTYAVLIAKIQAIGARPIILGVPGLAQTDADVPGFATWLLNDRAKTYVRRFYAALARQPLADGIEEAAVVLKTSGQITAGARPSVAGKNTLELAHAAATQVTFLEDGVKDQEVELIANNGNTTLVHSVEFVLQGSVNVVLTPGSIVRMRRRDPKLTNAWWEVSRSIK
jgi:lysophospholipase L1-like esterase